MKEYGHFSRKELECRHCHELVIDDRLVQALNELRALIKKPIIINCAYRCAEHNKAVGGVKNSQHVLGKAADIRIKGMTPRDIKLYALRVPAFEQGGIGTYKTFIHLDVRKRRARWAGAGG